MVSETIYDPDVRICIGAKLFLSHSASLRAWAGPAQPSEHEVSGTAGTSGVTRFKSPPQEPGVVLVSTCTFTRSFKSSDNLVSWVSRPQFSVEETEAPKVR